MTKIAILASHNGTGFDAINAAIKNAELSCEIVLVISNNTGAKVLQKAKENSLKNYLINSKTSSNPDEEIYALCKKSKCDIIFLSGYMKKLSNTLTQEFKIINAHPSLLPNYGGVGMYGRYVHEAVIQNAEKISGVTIHEVNANYDEGKILLQKQVDISKDETAQTLETKIKILEKKAIVEALKQCLK